MFCKKIPSDQLLGFIELLYDGLLDAQSHGSSGACVVLNSILKARGSELHAEVRAVPEKNPGKVDGSTFLFVS